MRERFENLRQSYQSSNDVQRDELISLLLFLYDSTHDGPKLVRKFRQITCRHQMNSISQKIFAFISDLVLSTLCEREK